MKSSVCWSSLSIKYLSSSEGTFFQQITGIPMATNCAHLLIDLFLYSYETEFIQKLIVNKKIFYLALWYIGDVRSINNPNFTNWTPLTYHQRTWDKENNRNIVLCFISWHLPLIWQQGSTTRLKFNFAIITFPHLDSFPIYISQLIRCTLYAWACNLYSDF
jgi:hypothetical protein